MESGIEANVEEEENEGNLMKTNASGQKCAYLYAFSHAVLTPSNTIPLNVFIRQLLHSQVCHVFYFRDFIMQHSTLVY